jgi:predicted molibdopterin-dependent oxidoreductase YjgC
VAGSGRQLPGRRSDGGRRRPLGAVGTILHSNGDGLNIAVRNGRIVGVRGWADDRVNHGRLGPKDLFGWQANNSPERLTRPLVRRDGKLTETDWDTAMETIDARTKALLDEQGVDAARIRAAVAGLRRAREKLEKAGYSR